MNLSEKLIQYIEQYSSAESEVLKQIQRETYLKQIYPKMLSGFMQGKFLEMLSKMIRPFRILEIGTFTGYSAICLAAGLQENGILYTIEKNPELEETISRNITKAGLEKKIISIIGNATQVIPNLNQMFDIVFIDADKENYPLYLELVFPKLKLHGYIIADNVLWEGKVIETSIKMDKETKGIIQFNEFVKEHSALENIILPIRDGLSIIRKI